MGHANPVGSGHGLAPSPWVLAGGVWALLSPPLLSILWWLHTNVDTANQSARGQPLQVETPLHQMLMVPLSLPVVVLLAYICYVGRASYVHN